MATRFTNPFPRYFTDNSALLSGGKLFFYVDDGGTTKKDTYSDNALSVPNANPVILDTGGVIPNIFLDGTYRVVLQDSSGVQQESADNVNAGSSNFTAFSVWDEGVDYESGPSVIVTGSDGKYYRSILSPNLANDPVTPSPTYWTRVYLISDTDPKLGGPLDGDDQIVKKINLLDYGEVVNIIGATGGGTQDIDLELGNVVSLTVDTSANTFTFSNPTATGNLCGFTIVMTNGGSQTVNWPASVDFPSGLSPVLTAAGVDILTFFTIDGGVIWYGFHSGVDMS